MKGSREWQQLRPRYLWSVVPLYKHGPGRPLINDEAYVLSYTRIETKATPGCRSCKP